MTKTYSLLIIDNDLKLQQMLADYFRIQRFKVQTHSDSNGAIELIKSINPDIVLLDFISLCHDGLALCREIRRCYQGKLMILTASNDDFDHISALEIGVDDYVVKPIKQRVLLARMHILLRINELQPDTPSDINILNDGKLTLHKNRKLCELSGQKICMTDKEFDLLWLLANSPGTFLSRDFLTKELRGIEYNGIDRTVDNKIVSLRRKLLCYPSISQEIITIRGKGYLFVPDRRSE
ncbi:response regulator transcription factor [Photobacterium damselae]|uniref:DNA-binding response regulator n=2 Tax=Photobacterium damselae TaxID=38293 RepID=D0Z4X7_PHODD|nr:response regulator transcription factor [Photobacterium damselae]EEZ39194.1 DNA-binding response regulator [Photobacterium damselae subsp. damselae CIP 102761]PSW78593.1 DNA-binding response regulator [Photobacterium damselae]SPY45074.1 Transcriptional regulatory protein RstA [Photobacterium damselae]